MKLKDLIKKLNNPVLENFQTNNGSITVFSITVRDERSIMVLSNNSKNSYTQLFYELLTMVCFPSESIYDKKRPNSPIFTIKEVKIIESKYIKKIILLLINKDDTLDKVVNKPDYQSSFIKQIIKKQKDFCKLFFDNNSIDEYQPEPIKSNSVK